MDETDTRAWWVEVEHLQEPFERRRTARGARGAALAAERRTVKIRGRAVPGVPRRALREDTVEFFDIEDSSEPIEDSSEPAPRPAPPRRRPRRPAPRAHERLGSRPDRIAGWAVLFVLAMALIAATTAHGATHLGQRTLKSGMAGRDVRQLQRRLRHLGVLRAPATARFGPLTAAAVSAYQRSRCLKADGVAGASTVVHLRRNAPPCHHRRHAGHRRSRSLQFGSRTLARGMSGRDVRTLQHLLGVSATGNFGPQTKAAVRAFQRRTGLGSDGAVGPATRRAIIGRRLHARRVTFFGPGLFGSRTACGQRLTPHLAGVAHRTLPCGTPVTLLHNGRFLTVRVVDRGPYTRGVTFDLTSATARAIGLAGTGSVLASS
ncbi:MAG: hypothetical protein NVSMB51_15060 [Solirubrobacteraceae bacterium]